MSDFFIFDEFDNRALLINWYILGIIGAVVKCQKRKEKSKKAREDENKTGNRRKQEEEEKREK